MRKQAELIGLLTAGGMVALGLAVRAIVRARRYISLENRTVLITGGSRGLGLMLARLAADQRANVAICARDLMELDRAQHDLSAHGGNILACHCDITVPEQVNELIQRVVARFGTIDVLVNNAGVIQVGPMSEMNVGDYDEAIKTHFNGPLHTILGILPLMRARGGGRIVNIASIGGKVAAPHLLPYTASKFALVGFSEGLRAELARENIFVTTVAPGLFRSGSPRHAIFKGQHQKEYAWFATADVLPGLSISPKRLARRILNAAKHGEAELITPLAASMQARLHGLMPGLVSEISAIINACLPSSNGQGGRQFTGAQSVSSYMPGFAQRWNDSAGEAYNEM
jgi:short-subunit dehydrogenase